MIEDESRIYANALSKDKQRYIMDRTATYYSGPTFRYAGRGGALGIYSGSRRQRGGNILGTLARTVLPIFGEAGKKILRRGAHKALDVTQNVAKDAIQGKNALNSFKTRATTGLKKLSRFAIDEGADAARKMIGSGKKRRTSLRKRKTTKRRRTKPRQKPRKRLQKKTTKRRKKALF